MFYQILSVSLLMSLIILILLMVSPFLNKRYTARWRYFIWLFIAIRLTLPFNISLPQAPVKVELPVHTNTSNINNNIHFESNVLEPEYSREYNNYFNLENKEVINPTVVTHNKKSRIISTPQLLIIIWAVGAIGFFLYHIIAYMFFRLSIKKWCKLASNISEKPPVMVCTKVTSPMLIGFIKPFILVPNTKYSDEELSVILAHERAHYSRGDLWYKLLLIVANSIHWFNPFVYAMVRYANFDLELTCDDIVVKNKDIGFRKAYSATILSAINKESSTALSTCFGGGKQSLKKRFTNILDMSKKRKGILAAIVILICIFSTGCLVSLQNNSDYKTNKQEDINENPYELSLQRLGSLANQGIGAVMASLVYADEKRVIMHYSYALIVYDIENERIYRKLDLEKLEIPYSTQGGKTINVIVNHDGTEIFIGSSPHEGKSFIYNIEESSMEQISDANYNGKKFKGLRDIMEISNRGYNLQGWSSMRYVSLENSVCYLLLIKNKVCDIKIIIEDENNKRREYTIFENTNITQETAIVIKNTPLYADMEGTEKVTELKKKDYVYVIYDENSEFYYIQTYDFEGNIPYYGYIKKNLLLFELPKGEDGEVLYPGDLVFYDTDLTYYKELQREADNGYNQGLLNVDVMALEHIHNSLRIGVDAGKITSSSIDGMRAHVIYETDELEITIDLAKPVKKDKSGIWIVIKSFQKSKYYNDFKFEEVSYLSPLSSTSIDFLEKSMIGTEYTITPEVFEIKYKNSVKNDNLRIEYPIYVKEEVTTTGPDDLLFPSINSRYQYTIYNRENEKTYLRIYSYSSQDVPWNSDYLWLASYSDTGTKEIIMWAFKLSK